MSINNKTGTENEYYINPIIRGDYADPSILRVGDDYYMTNSSFMYVPAFLIWHSRDLVHWEPICYALNEFIGDVWAPDLVMYKNKFYLYFPAAGTNWVITADNIEGPWSKPVDLKVGGIDPGHITDTDGNRYIYFSEGMMAPLAEDGLSLLGEPRKMYDGWEFPKDWIVEGFCLEGPKLIYKSGYYYMLSAEGGTAGPATSHMVVAARSKNVDGPWENSPYNPIVHTYNRDEKWHSKGHGTLIDTPSGEWYIVYHAYEKGFVTLGRQTLLEPIEWTEDGWFKIPSDVVTSDPIPMPKGDKVKNGLELSDTLSGESKGMQWRSFGENNKFFTCIPVDRGYEIKVKIDLSKAGEFALLLFYNEDWYCGVGMSKENKIIYKSATKMILEPFPTDVTGNEVYIRLRNDNHEVTFAYSIDGITFLDWGTGLETSGYNHNVFGGFLSLRIALYNSEGDLTGFSVFSYSSIC